MQNPTTALVGAIIVAGIIVAGAIIYTGKTPGEPQTAGLATEEADKPSMDTKGHALGNPDAELTLTNYFDINCGYCRKFHETMQQLIEKYGKDGKLKWISKHFALNPVSATEAEATECATDLAGEEMYWKFLEKIMTIEMPQQNTVINEMTKIAEELEINKNEFKSCLESGKFTSAIETMGREATSLGARGTPFSIMQTKSGKTETIPGALPYADMEQMIESLLAG